MCVCVCRAVLTIFASAFFFRVGGRAAVWSSLYIIHYGG